MVGVLARHLPYSQRLLETPDTFCSSPMSTGLRQKVAIGIKITNEWLIIAIFNDCKPGLDVGHHQMGYKDNSFSEVPPVSQLFHPSCFHF